MNKTERAYCAGIIDGEGTISVSAGKQWVLHHSYQVKMVTKVIRVSNTDRRLLDWLCDVTGCGKVVLLYQNPSSKYARFRKANIKPLYGWAIWGKNIKWFLAEIMPYLILKKKHAELMLESIRLSHQRGAGIAYADKVWERQLELSNEIKCLNKRGL